MLFLNLPPKKAYDRGWNLCPYRRRTAERRFRNKRITSFDTAALLRILTRLLPRRGGACVDRGCALEGRVKTKTRGGHDEQNGLRIEG